MRSGVGRPTGQRSIAYTALAGAGWRLEQSEIWEALIMQARAEARYRLDHGEKPALLHTAEEVDALIDSLLTGPVHENMAQIHSLERESMPSGFPDHELLVGVDRDLQVGVIAYLDSDGNVVTLGSPGRSGPVYYIQGHMTEFPANSEIPIDLVRRGVKEFLSSGGRRPACVQWQAAQA
ncbi:Imm1 family immunity protein [Streptomyces sp. NRRL F-5755]|uniref:Imm1 family immunity protein n=1 Tax=Streptomyces sp. NRRL F-5755 TaxID=1519475 RepID=UPI00099BC513